MRLARQFATTTCRRFLHWFTANIGVHHVHHLNSRIPLLPAAARCCATTRKLRNVGRLTLLQSFGCVRLVLWDETQRRLVSFRELRVPAPALPHDGRLGDERRRCISD